MHSSFSSDALNRWVNSLPSTPGRTAIPPTPPAAAPASSAGGGKRPAAFTPPSAETSRYRSSSGAGVVPRLDPLPGLLTIAWTLEAPLYAILYDFLMALVDLCTGDAEADRPLITAIISFLAIFSQATLRSYWARHGL